MVKQELIELIQHSCQIVDKTGKFDYRIIASYADMVYNEMLTRYSRRGIIFLENYAKIYDDVAISEDSYSDRYYSDLPTGVNLIDPPNGVIISTDKGTTAYFSPIMENEWRKLNNTEAGALDTNISFWVRDRKIWYDNNMTYDIANDAVRMVLAITFKSYANSDDINIPIEPFKFIEMVTQFATGRATPTDLLNNNADVEY